MNEKSTERVKKMDKLYDRIQNAIDALTDAIDGMYDIVDDVVLLEDYYENGSWLEDFEADERGEIPEDASRGILNEDLIYDILHEYDKKLDFLVKYEEEQKKGEL